MSILKTNYMGLELSSPIIAASCGFTSNVEQIKDLCSVGVGAVVLKSIFEEQIMGESAFLDSSSHSEESEYIYNYVKENTIHNYLSFIIEAKSAVKVPIIASINCSKTGEWVSFAKDIEKAGADAIELNIFFMPTSANETSASIEKSYLDIAALVVESVSIPVSVKLANVFTNPHNIAKELYFRGVKGVVLFNRFYEPGIDIDKSTVNHREILTQKGEARNLIRTIAIMSSEVSSIDLAATTGVETGEDALKMLLAGAETVQVCSVLYRHGFVSIKKMNDFIEEYMNINSYDNISDFRGSMNAANFDNYQEYIRSQFMKYYSNKK